MCTLNKTVVIDSNHKYFFSDLHRRSSNKHKSKWTIGLLEERDCFQLSCENEWMNSTCGWSLYIINGKIKCLGTNDKNIKLKIAKFVDKNGTGLWHGYPADYVTNNQDKPEIAILKKWVMQKYIDKVGMSRILSGKQGGI